MNKNILIIYDSSRANSVATAMVANNSYPEGEFTVTFKDTLGLALSAIDTYIGTLSALKYLKIFVCVGNARVEGEGGAGAVGDISEEQVQGLALLLYNDAVLTGVAVDGDTAEITFDDNASAEDDAYVGMFVLVFTDDTPDVYQSRRITAYDGATKTATVDSAWGTQPSDPDTYIVTEDLLTFGRVFKIDGTNNANGQLALWGMLNPGISAPYPLTVISDYGFPLIPFSKYNGTCTSSTGATNLTNSGAPWIAHELIGKYIYIYEGTGAFQPPVAITENATTTITAPFYVAPDNTSKYQIVDVLPKLMQNIYMNYAILAVMRDLTDSNVKGMWIRLFNQTMDIQSLSLPSLTASVNTKLVLKSTFDYLLTIGKAIYYYVNQYLPLIED